ncbi:hypothetical protein COO16_04275 [Bacillus pseudomycoides]|uniref:hypothetical protein n=1 Tax=Bacillus pseudomycoides TaxID=64104 RepID=UPI000BEE75AB|nr:hypothetical protein [Bacillus pseudomycoides]PDY14184.1 hypothetical protein COO16_04275 [Bacillus pseudomycoides]
MVYTVKCSNCAGHGVIEKYQHVENGICFKCSGSGVMEVSENEYKEIQKQIELKKKGSYILFNNGEIEYYKLEKEIIEKYGNFYCGDYGYSARISYKNEDIAYWKSTKNNNGIIQDANKHFANKKRDKLEEKIKHIKEMLKLETDQGWIDKFTNKINKIKSEINML